MIDKKYLFVNSILLFFLYERMFFFLAGGFKLITIKLALSISIYIGFLIIAILFSIFILKALFERLILNSSTDFYRSNLTLFSSVALLFLLTIGVNKLISRYAETIEGTEVTNIIFAIHKYDSLVFYLFSFILLFYYLFKINKTRLASS